MPSDSSPSVSEVTRRNIFDTLTVENFAWWGRLSVTEFLSRIFDLDSLPSRDGRFETAAQEITKHCELNDDWQIDWVFGDRRFNLLRCPDAQLFKFLAEMAHPVVQPDRDKVSWLIDVFNQNLNADGWVMVKRSEISGRPIFAAQRPGGSSATASTLKASEPVPTPETTVSKKTIEELKDYLSQCTLKEINTFFTSADFQEPSSDYVPPTSGQRRSLVAEYLKTFDPTNQVHVTRLLKLFEFVLITLTDSLEDNADSPRSESIGRVQTNLLRWLKRDGFAFQTGRLIRASQDSLSPQTPAPTRVPDPPPAVNTARSDSPCPPTAFISYSWDNEPHKAWVMEFAMRLRQEGIDAKLDRWELNLGADVPHFMETAVRTNDFVLILLTPNYRRKSDNRQGGVGYEGHIMTAELFAGAKPTKFIPVLREGSWDESSPSWLRGKLGVDLRQGLYHYDEQFHDLTATLHGMQKKAPPLGPSPKARKPAPTKPAVVTPVAPVAKSEPIRILNIIASEVGTPRNDRMRGGALYAVPFQLSRTPSRDWAEHFVQTWDRPPSFSTMHRPGIARIEGDRIILDGTTVEEVEKTHRDTLKVVLDKVNQDIAEHEARLRREEQRRADELRQHKQSVEDAAKKISFD
jgi:hypothetical protein